MFECIAWIGCFSFYLYSHSISPSTFTVSPFRYTHIHITIVHRNFLHSLSIIFFPSFYICRLLSLYFNFFFFFSLNLLHSCFSKWADNRLNCLKSFKTKWKFSFLFFSLFAELQTTKLEVKNKRDIQCP